MKKTWYYIFVPAGALLVALLYLWLTGEADAAAVKEKVVRFHVVAASDSEADQQMKLEVRNGVFELVEQLFADCSDQEDALETARAHQQQLQAEAERILQACGSSEPVTVEIGRRYFPTKDYGTLSFPAGQYQAVSLRIGEAKGENFWCVLFPALCLSPAVENDCAEDEMAAVVGAEETEFLKKSTETQQVKFFLVEWAAQFAEKFLNF